MRFIHYAGALLGPDPGPDSSSAPTLGTPSEGVRRRVSRRLRPLALLAVAFGGPGLAAVDLLAASAPTGHPFTSPIRTAVAAPTPPSSSSSSPLPLRSFVENGVPADVTDAVIGRLAIGALLAPDGIERPHWRSFDHVEPVPPAAPSVGTRFVVAIDPGHGGSDPGAEGPNGLLEKDLTLDIARRVRLFLSELDDVEVVLTRERDHGLSRASRVARVKASGADLFVSLHFNHLPQSEITLVESFYAGPENIAESRALQRAREAAGHVHRTTGESRTDLAFTRGSARFARFVQRRVFDEVGRGNERALDAGVKTDTLFVLTRSFTSGALVELTCLSNVDEAHRLTDETYRDSLAAGIADAIREYRASLERQPIDGTGA